MHGGCREVIRGEGLILSNHIDAVACEDGRVKMYKMKLIEMRYIYLDYKKI